MISALLNNYSYARKAITSDDYDYIYISPHLDDVTFSCSGTICAYKNQGARILIATLFAGDPRPPFPPLAQACHQLWQVPEDVPPYHRRKVEDEQAMSILGVDYVWLNWLELIYRDPTLSDLSDINEYHGSFLHDPIYPTLSHWLLDLQAAYSHATIVAPLGVGRHRDHGIVFQTTLKVLDHASLLFFEDFPYAAYLPEETTDQTRSYHLLPLEVDISHFLPQRILAAACYQSQHAMLFYPPSSFPEMIRDYTRVDQQDSFVERYWHFPL